MYILVSIHILPLPLFAESKVLHRCRFKGPQIRLVLNDSPVPLATICKDASKTYGSCSLDNFVAGQKSATSYAWGDSSWNTTCGNPGF